MKVEQVKNIVSLSLAQMTGFPNEITADTLVAGLDSGKIVDIGTTLTNMTNGVDNYVKALVDVIGKIYIDSKEYKAVMPSLFVDSYNWGGYLERVYFSPQSIKDDAMWTLTDQEDFSSQEHTFYAPKASTKFFNKRKAFQVPISITSDTLMSAFQSMEQLNTFISGIWNNINNTIKVAFESLSYMLVGAGIATAIHKNNHEIKLLSEYNALHNTTLNASIALIDKDFLTYASARIAQVREYLKQYSVAFNNKTIPTFTSLEDSRLTILSQIATNIKFFVKANTYNEKLLGFGDFDTVPCWQGYKDTNDDTTPFDFSADSKVLISADVTNALGLGTSAVECDNILAVLYDYRAMGITNIVKKTTSSYTASADFWNTFSHNYASYILDDTFPIIAFSLN